MTATKKILLMCPTLNAGDAFDYWLELVSGQSLCPDEVFIVDSSSADNTVAKAKNLGYKTQIIDRKDFNHGSTRNIALLNTCSADYLVLMTQDAFLSDVYALSNLVKYFDDEKVAAVCGRQLPRHKATLIERHARLYNYADITNVKSINDKERLGLKVAFLSNSFAAYRIAALKTIGGFPSDVIFGEDMYVAAKLLLEKHKIAYAADACVYHSHDYSLFEEMRRYFDMGVFHAREPWIRQTLGGAEGEGLKFVKSEFGYLLKNAFWLIPEAFLRTLLRYAGFRLGLVESKLSLGLKKRLAMNKGYFR